MIIHSAGKIIRSIDANNLLETSVTWFIDNVSNTISPEELNFYAYEWAGNIGDLLPVPDAEGNKKLLPDVLIDKISISNLTLNRCEVQLLGSKVKLETKENFRIEDRCDSKLNHYRKATFYIKSPAPLSLLPAIGDSVEWAENNFMCENITAKEIKHNYWQIELSTRNIKTRIIEGPTVKTVEQESPQIEVVYFVNTEEYLQFVTKNSVDSPAPWAGVDFVVRKLESTMLDTLGYNVKLSAQKVTTKMIECKRDERFAGVDILERTQREIIYKSRWLVHTDDLKSFKNITGNNASWVDEYAIVTSVTPKKISDLEYELYIEAQSPDNPNLFKTYPNENRTNLSKRVDLHATLSEFLISPEMAGYILTPEGYYIEDSNWDAQIRCPFVTGNFLDSAFVNSVVKTILITETRYRSGDLAKNLKHLTEWGSVNRIYDGDVGGIKGSFLRVNLDSEEISDNYGNRWTKFVGSYQMAPGKMTWNQRYWSGK